LNDTERAIKHFSAAVLCRISTPEASSLYATTTIILAIWNDLAVIACRD